MVVAVMSSQDKGISAMVNDIHSMYNTELWGGSDECELARRDNGECPVDIIHAVSETGTRSMILVI